MKLFLKFFVSILILALILASLGAGLYWYNWSQNAAAKVIDIKVESTNLKLGEPANLAIKVQTPWYRKVETPVELVSGENAALADELKIHQSGFNLSGKIWEIKTKIILFKEGQIKNLKLQLGLSPDHEKKQQNLNVSLPDFNVTLAGFPKTNVVLLKEKMKAADLLTPGISNEQASSAWIWVALAAFICAAAALALFLNRKGSTRILSPWEIARNSLSELKKELTMNDEAFFVRLSDILRQYIERRFALPATEKTSEEFIQQLRTDSILSEKQRVALERFLGTADLVKFARMNSDEKQKNECLSMADSFVDETIPQPAEGGK